MGTAPHENMVDAMKFCFMAFDIPENAMKTSYRSTINAVKNIHGIKQFINEKYKYMYMYI